MFQQEQMREWLTAQITEKQRISSEKRESERQYELRSRELDRRAVELNRNCEESRRQLQNERKSDNARQAEERRSNKQQEQAQEQDDNLAELSNWIRSDLLSENPEVSQSAHGTHRVVTDRWKGFTPVQVMSPKFIPRNDNTPWVFCRNNTCWMDKQLSVTRSGSRRHNSDWKKWSGTGIG